jgi:hypothetical protein
LLKLSCEGFADVGFGAKGPEPWVDRGVLRPEPSGDGVGRIEAKAEFMTGGFGCPPVGLEDQSRPERSSIVRKELVCYWK